MIVNWKKPGAGILTIPCITEHQGRNVISKTLVLIPGCNDIKDSDWKIARPQALGKIENGLIEEVKVKVVKEKIIEKEIEKKGKNGKKEIIVEMHKEKMEIEATELNDIPAKKAREVVKNAFNLTTLEKWLEKESRDEIRAVINNQMDLVNDEGRRK
jgi:hypothetical protein